MSNFWKIIDVDEVNSTNLFLHELVGQRKENEHLCVRSQFQTNGRGQLGNGWESEKGKNLTFSLVLYPDFVEPVDQYLLSQIVSISIVEVLSRYTDHVSIKWPNDIYWRDMKIAGILIENSISGSSIDYTVVGVGVNVNQEIFLSDAPNPVSLKMISKKTVDNDLLFSQLLGAISKHYLMLLSSNRDSIRESYFNLLYRKEGFHLYSDSNGMFSARILSVSKDGCLNLETNNGEKRGYYFKEVVFEIETDKSSSMT